MSVEQLKAQRDSERRQYRERSPPVGAAGVDPGDVILELGARVKAQEDKITEPYP